MNENVSKSFFISFLALLVFSGCLIEDVEQPQEIEAGQIFTSVLNIAAIAQEINNPHHGVISVLHPIGWEFESGTFESTDPETPSGNMILDPDSGKKWLCTEEQFMEDSVDFSTCADIDTAIGMYDGMEWTFLMSDVGDFYFADVIHEVTLNFNTENSVSGEYPMGYVTTVNTWGMINWLNDESNLDNPNMTDSSMNHIVNVTGGSVKVDGNHINPVAYYLGQNYPNPFNPESTIEFSIPTSESVTVSVYDLTGRLVKYLNKGFLDKGRHKLTVNGVGLRSGIYYYQIKTENFIQTRKMTFLK